MSIYTKEDYIQETMSIIYEKYKDMKFDKGILPWSYEILRNVRRGDYQKEKRRERLFNEYRERFANFFDSQQSSPDVEYDLKNALKKLSKDQKAILELKLKGATTSEIIDILGISKNLLYTRTHRAMKQLKRILE